MGEGEGVVGGGLSDGGVGSLLAGVTIDISWYHNPSASCHGRAGSYLHEGWGGGWMDVRLCGGGTGALQRNEVSVP